MSDVFLSYSRVNRDKAEQIAKTLEAEGVKVWWDKVLRAGQTYDEVTESMLRDAKVAVVLWSTVSVKSKWVRAEATLGERTSAVVPAMIEDAERPIMFELTQTADLIGWDGDREDERWKAFIADIKMAIEARANIAPPTEDALGPDATMENTFWTSIQESDDPADFEAYLKRYPTGHFSDLAQNRLSKLTTAVAVAVPPQPAPSRVAPEPAAESTPPPQPTSSDPSSRPNPMVYAALGLAALGVASGVLFFMNGGEGAGGGAGVPGITLQEQAVSPFRDCESCPEMTVLPAGAFIMGSPTNEPGRSGNEGPLREVAIPSFAMSTTEVTFDQWEVCVAGGGCGGYSPADRGFGRGFQPVLSISWSDAQSYVRWLSAETGRAYRLPTEAEWEYAARGGESAARWWGAGLDPAMAPTDAPKGGEALPPNPYGLRGMLGNVREWVEDCYLNNYSNAPTDGSAVTAGDCNLRVIRGASWRSEPRHVRAANRARISRDTRDRTYGFRVAMDMPDAER